MLDRNHMTGASSRITPGPSQAKPRSAKLAQGQKNNLFQYAPTLNATTLTVLSRITMSVHRDQFLTYQTSRSTRVA